MAKVTLSQMIFFIITVACIIRPISSATIPASEDNGDCDKNTNVYISIIRERDPSKGMGETVTQSVTYQVTKSGIIKASNYSSPTSAPSSPPVVSTGNEESQDEDSTKKRVISPASNKTFVFNRIFRKPTKKTIKKDENDNETNGYNDVSPSSQRSDSMSLVNQHLAKENNNRNESVNVYQLIVENNNILKELRKNGVKGETICPEVVQSFSSVVQDALAPLNRSESLFVAARKLGLHSFVKLLKVSGVMENLTLLEYPFTLFAPTDEAFRKLPKEKQLQLEDPDILRSVLMYHTVVGKKSKSQLDSILLETLNSTRKIRTSRLGGSISIQGADIVISDIQGPDGILHSITTVLVPPNNTLIEFLSYDSRFSKFYSLVRETGLMSLFTGLQPYTIFAPANQAFEKFPPEELQKLRLNKRLMKAVLLYHIYGPGTLYSNNFQLGSIYRLRMLIRPSIILQLRRKTGSDHLHLSQGCKTLETDIIAVNGVIHVIDTVLLPFGRDK